MFICLLSAGQFFFARPSPTAIHILLTPSISPPLNHFPLPPPHHGRPHPHNPASSKARPGRSLLFGESAPAELRVRPRVKPASRPGNIEKRAGHGRESILWLIRTSRKWREVTAKEDRRARLMVDSEPLPGPFPRPPAACFLHPRWVAYVSSPPRDDPKISAHSTSTAKVCLD